MMNSDRKAILRAPFLGAVVGLLLAIAILGPALKPGFLLSYDLVFVPDLALSDRTLGIDGSVPRAVPNDAVVAVLSSLLPGSIVQKILLVGVFVLLGSGLGLVLRSAPATIVATMFAAWNPWLAQRLEVGHWGFVLGYAALPWLVWAAQNCRRKTPYGVVSLGIVSLLVALTGSTGTVLAMLVLVGVLVLERPRRWASAGWGISIALLVSATWLWPFVNASSRAADPQGVDAFAAQADTPWGVLVSVFTGGGIWNQAAWYPERQSWVLVAFAFCVAVVGIVALFRYAIPDDGLRGLGVVGLLSFGLATMSALPGGREVLLFLVNTVPGAGLLRDSQKFAGPWMLAVSIGLGLLVKHLVANEAVKLRRVGWLPVVVGILAPVIMLPSLAWGSRGSWEAVHYPGEFLEVAEHLDQAGEGSVAVFPWIQYRRFDWNNNRIVLDPWNRLTKKAVIVNDGLPLRDGWISGEDPRAVDVSNLLAREEHLVPALRSLGIRFVLVLTDQPEQDVSPERLLGANLVHDSEMLQLWDLGSLDIPEKDSHWSDFIGWQLALLAAILVLFSALVARRARKK